MKGTNANLPDDIVVKNFYKVDRNYHVRFDATSREYLYVIKNANTPPAIGFNNCLWIKKNLNIEKMNKAAKYLIGEKDFSAFRASGCQSKSSIREITKAKINREGKYIYFFIKGNAFMLNMVRIITGTLLDVGTNKINITDFKDPTVIATGPLTSDKLSNQIIAITNSENLAFFDAIAPIVYLESIDMKKAWFQSRYDKGNDENDRKAYLNCPLNEIQYKQFIDDILISSKIDFKDWEKNTPFFQSCLPIEIMAESGIETLRFGPMKPVGLRNPHKHNERPHAVVQLRPDNKEKTLYNMVGFQTKMKYASQVEVFKKIPGMENVQFARLGGIHRNTFINTPHLLSNELSLKNAPNIYFAGQITGVEGYVECSAFGLLVSYFIDQNIKNKKPIIPPPTTAIGSLYHHLLFKNDFVEFQPMNVNFGLFKELPKNNARKLKKEIKKVALTTKAKRDWCEWMSSIN